MLSLLRIAPDFPPVEFSPTHCSPVDLDFSLTDLPPASSKVVLTLFAFSTLSSIRFFITLAHLHILGLEKEDPVQPLLYCICQFPNLINYHPQAHDGPTNSWLISKNPYQQSIADKELIFDKVVLINKEP
jgi:hypothetical protein